MIVMNTKTPTLKSLLVIALPMVISQASETVMLFVDRLFLSYLGKEYIAASMSGGLSSFVFSSFFTGIIGYVNAIAAQYYGAGEKRNCARITAQGLYTALLFFPLALALIPLVKLFFTAAGHTPEQLNLEFSYFRLLMFGALFVFIRSALVGFFLGIGKTRVVMWANIIGTFVNIPLNYLLIFGKLGFPALGIQGAAIGTISGSFTIMVILGAAYFSTRFHKEYSTRTSLTFHIPMIKKLFRYGSPAGVELFLNVFAFNIFLQLMHSYSVDVAAAVTITFNWDMVAFIPMIGLGFSTTALVGQQMGSKNIRGAEIAAKLALKTAYVYAGIMMMIFVFGAPVLVDLFSSSFTSGDQKVVQLARIMVRLAALYTLADATQLVFAGALRGAGDTKWVMFLSVIIHYLMAFAAFLLIKVFKVNPILTWIVFIAIIVMLGLSMFLRFYSGKWKKMSVI